MGGEKGKKYGTFIERVPEVVGVRSREIRDVALFPRED
jgi:hypothetical protein